jgi:hypothetical protein
MLNEKKYFETYKVKYHCVFAIYFPYGTLVNYIDFVSIWKLLSVFKNKPLKGTFASYSNPFNVIKTGINTGNSIAIEKAAEVFGDYIVGGGTSARKNLERGPTVDADFYFVLSGDSIWESIAVPPYLMISISDNWISQIGEHELHQLINSVFSICDKYNPISGLVDISDPQDCYGGMVYTSTFFLNTNARRWAEQRLWLEFGACQSGKIRGIYWSNYFNASTFATTGGIDLFQESYCKFLQSQGFQDVDKFYLRMKNGVLCKCSLEHTSFMPYIPKDNTIENYLWLNEHFNRIGALNYFF